MAKHARWEFRLEIEGLGIEAVTHPSMEQTLSGGTSESRVRVAGLKRDGLGFGEKVDMLRAATSGKGFTAKIVDRQRDNIWTQWFTMEPAATTFLSQNVTQSSGFAWVIDGSDFSAGDIIHIGTEAMRVVSQTVANRLRVTRAHWGSIAQSHYTQDGAKLSMPIVSKTRPLTLEGRRARLYIYNVGTDDLAGNGTQIYTGFVSRDAKLSSNLAEWSITVDSPYSLLKQDLGGALEDEIPPRGIYYPPQSPLEIQVTEYSSASFIAGGRYITDTIELSISGFFETQQDFCDEINSQLGSNTTLLGASGVGGWNADQIRAAADRDYGWHFEWTVGSVIRLVRFVMNHPIEGKFTDASGGDYPSNRSSVATKIQGDSLKVYPVVIADTHLAGAGAVPRGGFGGGVLPRTSVEAGGTIYIGGTTTIDTSSHVLTIATPDGEELSLRPTTFTASTRKVVIGNPDIPDDVYWYTGSDTLEIKLGRNLLGATQEGSLDTLRDSLVSLGPAESNLGTMPFFSSADLADWTTEIDKATGGFGFFTERIYEAVSSIETEELLQHECRLLGGFLAQTATGTIGFKRMLVPGPTDFSSVDLNETNIVTGGAGGFPTWERNSIGTVNTVTVKTGWDHKEEEHTGTTYTVRDVPAASARKALKMLEIAPRSRWQSMAGGKPKQQQAFVYQDAVRIALTPLSIFGRPYATIHLTVSAADGNDLLTTALLGEFVTISHSWLPNPSTGGRGISSQPAVIISRDWDLAKGTGTLTLLTLRARRAGYAPSLWLSGTPSLVSGTTYDCTVSYNDPDSVTLWSSGDTGSNRVQVGDELELVDFDTLDPTIQTGSVVQWNSSTSVRVTFDAAPSFSGEQYFRFASAATAVSTQQLYAYWADTDGTVGFASPATASVFG